MAIVFEERLELLNRVKHDELLLKDRRHMPHGTVPNAFELDAVAWKIFEALQQNAQQSFAEIGGGIGGARVAVAERVHRLEEAGVITGYHVALDIAKLGVPIRVLVRLTIPGGDLQITRSVTAIKELNETVAEGVRQVSLEVAAHNDRAQALSAASASCRSACARGTTR